MKQVTIITPQKPWATLIREWWDYREVLILLGWRDVILQYRQTAVGVLWVLIRPLLTVAIFTIVFNKIAGLSSGDTPYALVVFSGMLVWQFFADMFTYGSGSFLSNVSLISKVYFPRIMLPLSHIFCSLLDFSISFFAYYMIALWKYQMPPKALSLFLLPFLLVWLTIFSLSISLLFGSLVVRFRDFKHVIPFVVQLGLYCTPVAFSLSMIPKYYHPLVALNPLTGIINAFRYVLLAEPLSYIIVAISLISSFCLFFVSIVYFKRSERTFADFI